MIFKSILSGFIFYVLNLIYYLIKKVELKAVFFESLGRTIFFIIIFNLFYLLIKYFKNNDSNNSNNDNEKRFEKDKIDEKNSKKEDLAEDDGFSPINPPEIEYTQRED